VDVHDISMHLGAKPNANKSSLRFSESNTWNPDISDEAVLFRLEFCRAILASAAGGETVASAFASIGSLVEEDSSSSPISRTSPLKPRMCTMRPPPGKSRATPVLAISVDIPVVHVDVQKSDVDELQYWADDIGQLLERLADASDKDETGDSRDTSLIGSRFFIRSRGGSGFDSDIIGSANDNAESVLKLSITESKFSSLSALISSDEPDPAFIRLRVPRTDRMIPETRPFDMRASDLDALIELNADNKVNKTVRCHSLLSFLRRDKPF
jgi:autophagy-related protein 2